MVRFADVLHASNIYTPYSNSREVQILCYVASAVGRPVPNVPFSVMTGDDVNAVSKYVAVVR